MPTTSATEACPCRCGDFACLGSLGHDGLHFDQQDVVFLNREVGYDVAWSDDYLPLSAWCERWLYAMKHSGMGMGQA